MFTSRQQRAGQIIIRAPERQSTPSHVFLHLVKVHHFADQRNGTIIDLPSYNLFYE